VASYEELGVLPVINAAAAQTMLGGSLMPKPVLAAIDAAARSYVHLPDLHDRVGERIATLTRNEAACVSCGAAAGILLAVAAALTGDDADVALRLPDTDGLRQTEVIFFSGHDNGFLSAVVETGATLVRSDGTEADFVAAINHRTAAVLWFAGDFWPKDYLSLQETVRISHEHGVTVIVDAADQIPPVSRLWEYTVEMDAELAIFSGGKGLRGPQSSGLIVGRSDLVRACRLNSGPQHSIGRPAKVGKEEMLGVLAALEWSLSQDAEAEHDRLSSIVDFWLDGLAGIDALELSRAERSHSGQPIPRLIMTLTTTEQRDVVIDQLWKMNPRIAVLSEGKFGIALNPQGVQHGQDSVVLHSLRRLLVGGM
jgi:L-seryl-tRNA(Ser) seleniumtransferase